MLTGDQEETARAIAHKAGIDEVIAGVLPEAKAQTIAALQQGRRVGAFQRDTAQYLSEPVGAFIYNSLGILLAAGAPYPLTGALLSLVVAGAEMTLSSISVIGNTSRLLRFRSTPQQ